MMRGPNEAKTQQARRLRQNSTIAESRLWNRLRSRLLNGQKFLRQQPLGPFIVDFVCREKRVIVEVDGGQHADDQRDIDRDKWLTEHRYRVLRFWNNDVLKNTDGVLETIAAALSAEAAPPPPRPRAPAPPPPPGEGGGGGRPGGA